MEQEKRQCLSCGKVLRGRTDKKYCDDSCRNTYNNLQYSKRDHFVRQVNAALRKNRQILEKMLPNKEKETTVSRQELLLKGFDFNYHTQQLKTQKGLCFFCYEFGFLPLGIDQLLLVRRKN